MVAFRARALFREAKVCEKIAAAKEELPATTSRSKSGLEDSPDSGVSSPVKKPPDVELKGISASLLAKVSLLIIDFLTRYYSNPTSKSG